MTIILNSEQEQVLNDAIKSGLAPTADEALNQALESLRSRLAQQRARTDDTVAASVRRLATFGKRHGLSLGGTSIKELLNESRP